MKKGESGKTPAMVGSKKGAYAYSANTVSDAMSPNVQGWNSYTQRPERGGDIKQNGDVGRGGGKKY